MTIVFVSLVKAISLSSKWVGFKRTIGECFHSGTFPQAIQFD